MNRATAEKATVVWRALPEAMLTLTHLRANRALLDPPRSDQEGDSVVCILSRFARTNIIFYGNNQYYFELNFYKNNIHLKLHCPFNPIYYFTDCLPGYMFSLVDGVLGCIPCPIGTYRGLDDDMFKCIDCYPGNTTETVASPSENACCKLCKLKSDR